MTRNKNRSMTPVILVMTPFFKGSWRLQKNTRSPRTMPEAGPVPRGQDLVRVFSYWAKRLTSPQKASFNVRSPKAPCGCDRVNPV